MKIQQIPVRLEGTIEVILGDDEDPQDSFDLLFDKLTGRTWRIVTDEYDFDFDCAGLGLSAGRKVTMKDAG